MTQPLKHDRTIAVIAMFNPDESLLANVATIISQVSMVIAVDDGSDSPEIPEITRKLRAIGVEVFRTEANRGIAAALNWGIREGSKSPEVEFFLTLDQDSSLAEGYVKSGIDTYKSAVSQDVRVGFVSAESFDGTPFHTDGIVKGFFSAFDPLQSGSLIPSSTIERVGAFDETLFIDGVDSDFTARVKATGYKVIIGPGCQMTHSLGDRRKFSFLGRETGIEYNFHSPTRVYYMARNGVIIATRYLRKLPLWVARRATEDAKAHAMRLVFSPGRAKNSRAIILGVRDAALRRTGPAPDSVKTKRHRS